MAKSECMKKHASDLKNANQKAHGLENKLKHARINLVVVEQVAIDARNEVETAIE